MEAGCLRLIPRRWAFEPGHARRSFRRAGRVCSLDLRDKPTVTIRLGRNALITGVLVTLVVIMVAFGFTYWNHREAEHKARIAAAQARYAKYKSASDKLVLGEQETEAWNAYNRDLASGRNSSQERHDYLASGNNTDQHVLSLITNENDMANQADVDEGEVHRYLLQSVDAFEAVYGEDATRNVRADEMRRDQLALQSLSYWQRVSQDIKDSVRAYLDGRYGSGDSSDEIDNLYEQTSQYDTQAKTMAAEEHHDFAVLKKRLQSDTARARLALEMLVPTPTYPGSPAPGPEDSKNGAINVRVADLLMRARAAHLAISRPQFDETTKGTRGAQGPLPAMDEAEIDFTGNADIQFNATALENQGIAEERWIFKSRKISPSTLQRSAEWLLQIFYPVDVQSDFRNAKASSDSGGYTEYRGRRFVYFTDTTYSSFGVMTPAGYKLFTYMSD